MPLNERFKFAGRTVKTELMLNEEDRTTLFFIDVEPHASDEHHVTIGWGSGKFGVYVDGALVYPNVEPALVPVTPDEPIHPDDLITEDLASAITD